MIKAVWTVLLLVSSTVLALDEPAFKAGSKASMDIDVLEQAKDIWFDEIIGVLNGLQIPDLEDADGNYIKEN